MDGDHVRKCVHDVCGTNDEIVTDMIARHLERCAADDGGGAGMSRSAELASLLEVLLGASRALQLADAITRTLTLQSDRPCARQGAAAGANAGREGWSADGSRRLAARGMTTERSVWPFGASIGQLPLDARGALDAHGPFGQAARGVEVRPCTDNPSKGLGVFAIRELLTGALVGLYWGEWLTRGQYCARHGEERNREGEITERGRNSFSAARGSLAAIVDRATAVERRARLEALTHGRPMGGGGAYVFLLPHGAECTLHGEPVYCVDAEDPNRSSWCRYLNHAKQVRPRVASDDEPLPSSVSPPLMMPLLLCTSDDGSLLMTSLMAPLRMMTSSDCTRMTPLE